ncbi:alginate lyase family protein [Sungkyunkwania multivorans]|uniref:Alginate lyase family protein n=1 Tax=Sungkyunkwania multivorans TaxID=1173618 RepID=A0ABW3CZ92_9FLAO
MTKLHWQTRTFPTNPPFKEFISLEDWKKELPPFFFYGKDIHGLPKRRSEELKSINENLQKGILVFFNKLEIDLGKNYDWITNPATGYKYDIAKHWSQIEDLSKEAGDIKYVWEKARFSFLFDIIRYDYHFEEDQSKLVFGEIEDFIDKNPINLGPNYKCSQETSLRILNWTFALYYYKDSENLTEGLFKKIMNSIYWQLDHVYRNIHFSRIAVRNNHALTETLMLYLSNKLFPFIPDTRTWNKKGKKWFEQEIAYQIYEDGTFLQYSMNYHRVAVQLLTYGIRLAELNDDKWNPVVYERAKKSLQFLDACTDPVTKQLPNYGANDGALFFKLTDDDYRNYSSQLDDLRSVLYKEAYEIHESAYWLGIVPSQIPYEYPNEMNTFEKGGYYIIQEESTKTFIRCGKYQDRPSQSDNLHLDIWHQGINYLRDAGSYKYNTKQEDIAYFNGCEGHNTISVDGEDQMLKGSRFIWFKWVKKAVAVLNKEEGRFHFKGKITAFRHLGKDIEHVRTVKKQQGKAHWTVVDEVKNTGDRPIFQYWHLDPEHEDDVEIVAKDLNGNELQPLNDEKWYSGYYGVKERSPRRTFTSSSGTIVTTIKIDKA